MITLVTDQSNTNSKTQKTEKERKKERKGGSKLIIERVKCKQRKSDGENPHNIYEGTDGVNVHRQDIGSQIP